MCLIVLEYGPLICDSYLNFGETVPRQTGVLTQRKKVGAFNASPKQVAG